MEKGYRFQSKFGPSCEERVVGAVHQAHVATSLCHIHAPCSEHGLLELLIDDIEDSFDPILTVTGKAPEYRTSDHDNISTKDQSFQHVVARSYPTIKDDRDILASTGLDSAHDLAENLDCGGGGV